jgi:hypothetical protein
MHRVMVTYKIMSLAIKLAEALTLLLWKLCTGSPALKLQSNSTTAVNFKTTPQSNKFQVRSESYQSCATRTS